MKLVVGLGNPGSEYARTRHNVGFEALDHVAVRLGLTASPEEFNRIARNKFDGLVLDGTFTRSGGEGEKVLLLKPMTYMNLSGRAVQSAAGFYQVDPSDIMVVLDDLALPCGKLRIRSGGSDGGHNGLRDIQRALGTTAYPRLRIGIDPPPPLVAGKDYVLGRFTSEQRLRIDPALARSADAIATWIDTGITTAMNRFNADADEQKSSESTKTEPPGTNRPPEVST